MGATYPRASDGALFTVGYRTARVCLLLWYVSSFAGMIWLVLAFEKWKQTRVEGRAGVSGKAVLRDAVLVALLLLPIGLVHHLMRKTELALYVRGGAMCVAGACDPPAVGKRSRRRHHGAACREEAGIAEKVRGILRVARSSSRVKERREAG